MSDDEEGPGTNLGSDSDRSEGVKYVIFNFILYLTLHFRFF